MRFKLLSILILLFIGGFSQTPDIVDSLKGQLEQIKQTDSLKVNLLLQLSYHSQNSPFEALRYGEEALRLATDLKMQKFQAYAHGYIGMAEDKLGNSADGVEHYVASANLYRGLGMSHEEAYALGSIGTAFLRQDDLNNAIEYYKQSLEVFKEFNDSFSIANVTLNIGESYREFDQLDSAEHYYNEALRIFNQLGSQKEIMSRKAMIIGNLGLLHYKKGLNKKAKQELKESLERYVDVDELTPKVIYMSSLGELYCEEGNYLKGLDLMEKSMVIAYGENLKEQIKDISLRLSNVYEQNGDLAKSLSYYKRYKAFDDSVKNITTVRRMERMQSRFELNKKEEQIEALNRLNQLQKILAYVLMISAVVFLIFIFKLNQSNRKIKEINGRLLVQKEMVEKSEEEKSLLLRELNHRVKNNLQMVSSLLNLQARQLKGHPAAEALKAGRYRVEALTLIHQKLYKHDVDTKIDIKDYVYELSNNLVMSFAQNFQLELDLNPLVMKIDKAIPLGLIINELITNALKYASRNNVFPWLKISLNSTDDDGFVMIEDNGPGLPDDFDFSKASSFGIKLVNSLIKQLDGSIECDSTKGTCWKVYFRKT
ncbi:MAG: tetratricopeptide repeat protein [Prolixibacteraceae bacterium]|jgi:two-component sensor histidine kinase|nr:tetratricopeptide repeat protein [Prolixibacteraceae bacterium]